MPGLKPRASSMEGVRCLPVPFSFVAKEKDQEGQRERETVLECLGLTPPSPSRLQEVRGVCGPVEVAETGNPLPGAVHKV